MSQPPAGYGYPAVPQEQRPTETMAILAIVFAFVFPVLGIVFGILGRRNVERTGNNGRGLATAGLWISVGFTVLYTLLAIFYVVVILAAIAGSTSP